MRRVVFVILLIGFILRLFWLDEYPKGFNPDEASFGYDAYSILKTGKDQWGHSFPLVLESFGDFKSPLYAYLVIPSVKVFGLNKFAVRFPNALLGSLAVYVTFLLAKELRKNLENGLGRRDNSVKVKQYLDEKFEIIAGFLLAISPWHIMMSRGAFEANLTTFFLPLGVYLFLKGLEQQKYFTFSAFVLGLNIFTYHAAKLVTPIVIGALILVFLNELKKLPLKMKILPSGVFLVFFVLFLYSLTLGSSTRAADVLVFKGSLEASAGERLNTIVIGVPENLARFLHNKFQVGLRRFVANYLQYYSPLFMFIQGPAEGTYGMIQGRGVLYWFELPFLLSSILFFAKRGVSKVLIPFLVWIIVAPIPAALATGPGYAANRSVILLPCVQLFLAFGAVQFFGLINQGLTKNIANKLYLIFFVFSLIIFIYFLDDYYIQSPYKSANQMLYGNLEVAHWLGKNTNEKDRVVVSTQLSEPHIYIAFAKRWDPVTYQEASKSWGYKDLGVGWVDQIPEYRLGSYIFKRINQNSEDKNSYLVGKPEEFPLKDGREIIIKYPDNSAAIYIITPQKETYAQGSL